MHWSGIVHLEGNMASFLADENISKPVVRNLNNSGLSTVHIKYDLQKGGILDNEVHQVGKSKKLTILTNDGADFKKLKNTEIKSGPGIWCLDTADPDEQVKRVGKISKLPHFKTKKNRQGKLLVCTHTGVTATDGKTQKTEFISWNQDND